MVNKNVSFFYTDWKSITLTNLFWSWFSDMMSLDDIPSRTGSIKFIPDANGLWDSFCTSRRLRIAINTGSAIGMQNGVAFHHLAIDLDLAAAVAHGYPVSATEAIAIMGTSEVRLIKSQEY